MKIVKEAGKTILKMSLAELDKMAESKSSEKSPLEHGFMDQCMKKNKDKDNPGAYCASIVDKAKGTTDWRKGPKKD